jgi:hypothetical protein
MRDEYLCAVALADDLGLRRLDQRSRTSGEALRTGRPR